MAPLRFTLTVTPGEVPRDVEVVVYDTLRAMRGAITRFEKLRNGAKRGEFNDTCGICHRFERFDIGPNGGKLDSDLLCAIVRLAEPYLGIGIVSHELTHAAVWIRELEEGVHPALSCENDELLAWTVGELVSATVRALYEFGVWDDNATGQEP